MEAFFQRIGACGHLLAWEARGDWPSGLARDLRARLHLIPCVDPFVCEPVTTGVRYFRLHGRARVIAQRGHVAYVMFNNVWMEDDAARFLALAG